MQQHLQYVSISMESPLLPLLNEVDDSALTAMNVDPRKGKLPAVLLGLQ